MSGHHLLLWTCPGVDGTKLIPMDLCKALVICHLYLNMLEVCPCIECLFLVVTEVVLSRWLSVACCKRAALTDQTKP